MIYVLPFPPIALQRPRFSKSGHVYDPQQSDKEAIQLYLLTHYKKTIYDCPLFLFVTFYVKIPQKLKQVNQKPAISRPDLDNYIKFLMDVLNEIFYMDDAIVTEIHAKKIYDTNPRTEFKLQEIL